MRDGLTPEEQRASELVIKELGKGASKETIVETLVKRGWVEETATKFVNDIEQVVGQFSKYKRRMFYGMFWVIGGTVVTVASHSAAGGGGRYKNRSLGPSIDKDCSFGRNLLWRLITRFCGFPELFLLFMAFQGFF